MAARTVSELASWDGRRDQQRQNSKWPTRTASSSSLTRDPHRTSLRNQPAENAHPPGRIFDQKRVERPSFHSGLERDSFSNASANKQVSSWVDTTAMSSLDVHHSHSHSISSNASSSRLQSSSFTRSSKSSRTTPNSSVHGSRVHKPQLLSSRQHVPLSQASKNDSDIIDLTLDDTEDESPFGDKMVRSTRFRNQRADPGPSRRRSPSEPSSPIAPEESLFTPPPPSRSSTRLSITHIAVPSFPEGLTKADYRPMSEYLGMPSPNPSAPKPTPRSESPVVEKETHASEKSKGKEREHDVPSPPPQEKQPTPPNPALDEDLGAVLDAFNEPTILPVEDDDSCPPLTSLDLSTNTRFYFVHAWRGNAAKLQEAESDWMFKILGKSSVWAQSLIRSPPRLPGTTGCVSIEQLRAWELVEPESSLPEKQKKDGLEEQNHQADTQNHTADPGDIPPPDNSLPIPNAVDPPPSNPTVSQGPSSTAMDMEHDMNQYFDGLGDSPHKQPPPRQQLDPIHPFRPLLQSARHTQMNAFDLDFPALLADTGGNECFLGVPPSPPIEDIGSSVVPPTTSPFRPASYFPAQPGDCLSGDASSADAWPFERDGPPPDNDPPPSEDVSPIVPGTIDPSLLGLEQPRAPSVARKDATPKRRSKLPEPVVYVRRPIDPSSLPLISGGRPVQIKYRDAEGSSATPLSQAGSMGVPSISADSPIEASTKDWDDLPRVKRRSAPTRKLVEAQAAPESDSDYAPESSKNSKSKLKRRPSGKDKESVSDVEEPETGITPVMSSCHQCRNKTVRPKMLCSNVTKSGVCGKRFCNRCILYRYPDITFDEHSAGFLCPACTNTCNCSYCSRNRGEEFVSMRLGGVAASLFTAKVTLVRDVGKSLHRTKSPTPRELSVRPSAGASASTTPTPEPGTSAGEAIPSQFWAHVYGMEGERMGSAFMTRDQMARLQAGSPSVELATAAASASKSVGGEKKRKTRVKPQTRTGPRVFIGEPLPSWKIRAVRDLEPSVDVDVKGKGKAREDADTGTSTCVRRRRYYVGSPAALHEPYGRMPGAKKPRLASMSMPMPTSRCSSPGPNSDGSLTPLAEDPEDGGDGDGYWPQPAVGECCAWAPPGMMVTGGVGTAVSDAMDVDGPSPSPGLGFGMDTSAVGMDVDGGNERPVTRALSEEEMARAISAALAALSVDPPLP